MGLNVYQYYKDAPPAGKIVIIGVGALAAIAGYYAIRNTIKKIQQQKELKGQRQTVDDSRDVVKVLEQQGKGPTYPDAQYSAWATGIQAAFEGCDPNSDDYQAAWSALYGCRNEADVYKLIASFGVRKWDECGWGTGDVEKDLVGGIRHELDKDQIGYINTLMQEKGISIRF